MNFLSHYYFDQSSDAYTVLGTLLPDLTKNTKKDWKIHPQKHPERYAHNHQLQAILHGWNRHLLVDKLFHSSTFFQTHSHQLGTLIHKHLVGTAIKPYFFAHISLELLLDAILLKNNQVNTAKFYRLLSSCNTEIIDQFLALNELEDRSTFFIFFERFVSSEYLNSYRQPEHLTYALNRICMRIWPEGLAQSRQEAIGHELNEYQSTLEGVYKEIFDEIAAVLSAQKIR